MISYTKHSKNMIRKYHNRKLQTSPWYREEEPDNNHEAAGGQTKRSKQLSLPHQDDSETSTHIEQQLLD